MKFRFGTKELWVLIFITSFLALRANTTEHATKELASIEDTTSGVTSQTNPAPSEDVAEDEDINSYPQGFDSEDDYSFEE